MQATRSITSRPRSTSLRQCAKPTPEPARFETRATRDRANSSEFGTKCIAHDPCVRAPRMALIDWEPKTTLPGAVICGRYRLVSQIGAGAMGAVWRATDTTLLRTVAIKLLWKREDADGPTMI